MTHAVERVRVDRRAKVVGDVDRQVGSVAEDRFRELGEPRRNVDLGRHHPDRVGLEPGEVEQAVDEVDEPSRLLGEHASELAALFVGELVLALVQRADRPVDGAGRGAQLVRGERDELALQLVQASQLPVLDRLLEKAGDQGAEGGQQVDLGLVEEESLCTLVAGHEAETAAVSAERHDHEGAEPEVARDLLRYRFLGARILDVHGPARGERPRERAEVPDGERRRQRTDLVHRQPVAGEGHERRGVGQEADDPDSLKGEAAGDRGARTLQHRTRAKLAARQSAGEAVQRLELGGFGGTGHVVRAKRGPQVPECTEARASVDGSAEAKLRVEPRDLEDPQHLPVGANDHDLRPGGAHLLPGLDQSAEHRRVDEGGVRQVDDDPGSADATAVASSRCTSGRLWRSDSPKRLIT